MALLDTANNVCLSDYAADHQLYSALGNTPDTFSLSGSQLKLLGMEDNSSCDVAQGAQLECNSEFGHGSNFSVTSSQLLQYQSAISRSFSSQFYGCTNQFPPVGAPSTNYFDYSQTHAIYAAKGSPVDKFSLAGAKLTLSVDGWHPLCVTSESGGYSKQFQCSNDIDYSDGEEIKSSYEFTTTVLNGHTILAYSQRDGSYSTSFYGCGPDSAVYFAVDSDPSSSPGTCHAALLAFVDESQCHKTTTSIAVPITTLVTISDETTQKADELGLNDN
ncbi:protein of unknown function [Taphrina deformans PYCC 5710]|uniref:Uncharacterized protein n=1 Tax=Taphrina deformans (strain PYCC 5710 / ATCC 11124 / CBS 356.35 / IMI 108563 / JCM 9778 / NBRC 8474) TaxID=1097556 RepID=R4X7Y4_TAPDE|nr:protein of unknown function [Taphrina deformans PYCC 5710]|eukprot:CCG81570.1 protein of unknown function [Taphrina deformans PYCC 5710]